MATKAKRNKVDKGLKSWLASARKAGYADAHIRKVLKSAGWHSKQIDAVLPASQVPKLDFVFLGAVFIAIAVTFVLYLSSNPELQEFLTASPITGSSVSEAPAKEFKLSVSQPKVKIDFTPRPDKNSLPVNWFISEYFNTDGTDKKEWTWVPLDSRKQGAFIVDLGELQTPSSWSGVPRAIIYSMPIDVSGASKLNISLVYAPEFSGTCLQIGMETLFEDGTGDATLVINLDEFGNAVDSDFDVAPQAIENKTHVSAASLQVISNPRVVFYIYSLCGAGRVAFEDFTVEKMAR